MTEPCTIQGELRLPAAFMHTKHMAAIESELEDYGLLPFGARNKRWRMDHEHPGGYVVTFTVVLPATHEED